jgi:hypothetical protein
MKQRKGKKAAGCKLLGSQVCFICASIFLCFFVLYVSCGSCVEIKLDKIGSSEIYITTKQRLGTIKEKDERRE